MSLQQLPHSLVFMRHGIAEDRETYRGKDKDRKLTDKGHQRTKLMSHGLLSLLTPTHVISSDYIRAMETADVVEKTMKSLKLKPPKRTVTEALGVSTSWQDWKVYFKEFSSQLSKDDMVLLIGHEPSISELFSGHLGLKDNSIRFKKAGFAIVSPHSNYTGELVAFCPPKIYLSLLK